MNGQGPEIVPSVHEANIQQVAEVIRIQRERPESREMTGAEQVRQSIQAISASVLKPTDDSQSPLPRYVQDESPEVRHEVEHLLTIAFQEGLVHGLKEAERSQSPFILDAFHDALTGRLYPELQRRGIVE